MVDAAEANAAPMMLDREAFLLEVRKAEEQVAELSRELREALKRWKTEK